MRVTKLDGVGNVVVDSAGNSYVSDRAVSLAITPNIETGNTFSLRSGCGCSLSRFKARDILNWFDFTFTDGALEPEMMRLMLGINEIKSGADAVGVNGVGSPDCSSSEPSVALEFWTKHLVGNTQDSALPWVHWVFPKTIWQIGTNTADENFLQTQLTGFSRENDLWGHGPYGDGPPDGSQVFEWAYWKTATTPPVAECVASNVAVGS
jgi:hypothetical protein